MLFLVGLGFLVILRSINVFVFDWLLGSLSNGVFERRTSTGSGLFASLGSGLVESLGLIVFIREKKLCNTNFLASRHMYSEKASLPVDVRQTSFLTSKLPISTPYHVIFN